MTITPEKSVGAKSVAIVLASHGDRGGGAPNSGLATHVKALGASGQFGYVTGGVLNGEPSLESALGLAEESGCEWILVYPMFMSAGYFAAEELPRRVKAAELSVLTSILQPLGVDQRAPLLMLESSLRTAKAAGINPADTRLLVVGHGSKHGPANADATRAAARIIEGHSPFARIDTAFIEEAPFVTEALSQYEGRNVVAGFFSGDGMHAGQDIPDAIRESGAAAVYTGPVGLHPRVPELIVSSVGRAVKARGGEPAPAPVPQGSTRLEAERQTPPTQQVGARPDTDAQAPPREEDNHRAPAPERKKRSFLKTFSSGTRGVRFVFTAVFTLFMLAVLGIAALAFLVPEETVREQVTSLVKEQTGRDLTIGGDISLAWFPNIGVKLGDVRISNPPGMKSGETLTVDTLTVDLKLLPLLGRRVEVDRFVLTKPVFNLLSDTQGRTNWDFEKKSAAFDGKGLNSELVQRQADAKTNVSLAQAGGLGGGIVQDIRLGTVKIVDGTVTFTDERTGTSQNVGALNVSVIQPRLSDPLNAKGDLNWRGEKVTFEGGLDKVPALLRKQPSKARIKFGSPHADGSFDGQLQIATDVSASGALSASTKSVRSLAQWVGSPLPSGGGLGPASISGQLGLKAKTISFARAKLSLDNMKGSGQASVRLGGKRPLITASLALDKLDLNTYLHGKPTKASPQRKSAPVPSASKSGAPSAGQSKSKEGQSLTDFIEKLGKSGDKQSAPKPQVRAWSKRAIDLRGLGTVDANIKLTTGAIFYQKIKTGQSALTAALNKGVLTADLTKLALYSGAGTGRVTLNGTSKVPAMAAVFNLKGVSALPLLKDASDFDWVSGRANIDVKLTGAGRSQKALVGDLQGNGRFAFADGAIEGINIPEMMRGLKLGKLDGWKRANREKTDFSELSASFTIQKGIAYNKDLKLIGPLVRMTGEGNVNIGRERIDYTALPRIVANLQGQGAVDDPKRGLAIPVRITGPWAKPKIVPDLDRLMRDPELAKDAVDKVGKALKKLKNKEDVNKLLQGVLGGGNQQAPDGTQPQGEQASPEDILKNLLR